MFVRPDYQVNVLSFIIKSNGTFFRIYVIVYFLLKQFPLATVLIVSIVIDHTLHLPVFSSISSSHATVAHINESAIAAIKFHTNGLQDVDIPITIFHSMYSWSALDLYDVDMPVLVGGLGIG